MRLQRIGELDAADPPIEPSDREWEYRAKITLACAGPVHRLSRVGTADQVFDLRALPPSRDPRSSRLWAALRPTGSCFRRNLEPDRAAGGP